MKRTHLKMVMAATLLLSALVFGVRAGERVESPPFERSGLGLVLILGVHGLFLAPTRPRKPGEPSKWLARQVLPRTVFAGLILVVGAGGFGAGTILGRGALTECLERGEEVRAAVAGFHERTGHYPPALDAVGLEKVGDRLLNQSLLEYRVEGSGYVLGCKDRRVEHRASESLPFQTTERGERTPPGRP